MPLTGTRDLQHKDRVLFGSNHLYVFMNPLNTECGENVPETVDWDFAQKEIAEAKGFNTAGGSGLSQGKYLFNFTFWTTFLPQEIKNTKI